MDYWSVRHQQTSCCHNAGEVSIIHIEAPPNKPLYLMPLRVEQERADFEGWMLLARFPDLSRRRI